METFKKKPRVEKGGFISDDYLLIGEGNSLGEFYLRKYDAAGSQYNYDPMA